MNKKLFLLIFSLLTCSAIHCMEDSGKENNEPIENNEFRSYQQLQQDLIASIDNNDAVVTQIVKHINAFTKAYNDRNSGFADDNLRRRLAARAFMPKAGGEFIIATKNGKRDYNLLNFYSDNGHTPLTYAIEKGRPGHAALLVQNGASPMLAHKTKKMLPLQYAQKGNDSLIIAIIERALHDEGIKN